MKLKYEKPMIAVENYELSQSIAACDNRIGFTNSECVIKDPDATDHAKRLASTLGWFMEAGGCGLWSEGADGSDGICYNTNANAMFTS